MSRNGDRDGRENERERALVSCDARGGGYPKQGRRRRLWTPAFAGVTKSESGGLGELALLEDERVIEPVRQRLDVSRFDRCAAPDAQAGRRVPISADVKRDLFLFKQGRQPLANTAWASAVRAATEGSTTLRQTLVFERVSGALARKSIQSCARPSLRSPWRWRRRGRKAPSIRRATSPSSAHRDSPRRTALRGC